MSEVFFYFQCIEIAQKLHMARKCAIILSRLNRLLCSKKSTFTNISKRLLILSAKVGFDFANMSEKLKDFPNN